MVHSLRDDSAGAVTGGASAGAFPRRALDHPSAETGRDPPHALAALHPRWAQRKEREDRDGEQFNGDPPPNMGADAVGAKYGDEDPHDARHEEPRSVADAN